MLILNPAEMRETDRVLAEALAKYRFNSSSTLEEYDYCAAVMIDGALVPIRPLLISGLKQATHDFKTATRYWLSNSGKLLSLQDEQICAVNYFSANGHYVLDVKPAAPVKLLCESVEPLASQFSKWGQSQYRNPNELVKPGFNGHIRVLELINGVQLASPNHHLIANWRSKKIDGTLTQVLINSIHADLKTNEFHLKSSVMVQGGKDVTVVEASFDSLTKLFDLGINLDLSIPKAIKEYRYDTPKMVSLEHGRNLQFLDKAAFAQLWNAIEIFRLRKETTVMTSARFDAWIKLLSLAITTFQGLRLNPKSPYGGNLRNCLEVLPISISELQLLMEKSSLIEANNQKKLDSVIQKFISNNPGLYQQMSSVQETEDHHYFSNCESRYGLQN